MPLMAVSNMSKFPMASAHVYASEQTEFFLLFQGFYVQIRKLEKLAEDNYIDESWLMDLLRELMAAILAWIAGRMNTTQDTFTEEQLDNPMQVYAHTCTYYLHCSLQSATENFSWWEVIGIALAAPIDCFRSRFL